MLSIKNVKRTAKDAAEYYRERDNYYVREGEGRWWGKGAEALGLKGAVGKEDFIELLEGRAPDGRFAIEKGGEEQTHRRGTDLTFSAPKSVSLLALLTGDQRVREAHRQAVEATLKIVEERFSEARLTVEGQTTVVPTKNLIIANFEHNLSRELDPHLHTHCIILNATQRPDGAWRAFTNEAFRENKLFLGQYYRNELALNLRDLGYGTQTKGEGKFDVRGIDERVLEAFSRRSEQLEAMVEVIRQRYPGANESRIRELAALASRVQKRDVDPVQVRAEWRERLQELGYSVESLRQTVLEAGRRQPVTRSPEAEEVVRAAELLTQQESTFERKELLRTAGALSLGVHRIGALEEAFDKLVSDGRELLSTRGERKLEEFTTRQMLDIERAISSKVQAGRDQVGAVFSREALDPPLREKYAYLTRGQQEALTHILTTTDRVIGVQGDAGTGKTTLLSAVREQLEERGYTVRGLSFTGKAAAEVEKTGIAAQTLHAFLGGGGKDSQQGGKEIWVIDEASMVGSRQLHQVLDRAEQSGARVVLVGDTKQLPAIHAGRMFAVLQETGALRTVALRDVVRQQEEGYRAIVERLAQKDVAGAVDLLNAQGRIKAIEDRSERLDAVVREYHASDRALVVTSVNQDRHELNLRIREGLRERGTLKGEERIATIRDGKSLEPIERHFAGAYQAGEIAVFQKAGGGFRAGTEARVIHINETKNTITLETLKGHKRVVELDVYQYGDRLQVYKERGITLAAGERVVFTKNSTPLGIMNGVTGEIEKMDQCGNVHVRTDSGKQVFFNFKDHNYLDHGYAVTTYKSQGQTTEKVLYHADTEKQQSYNEAYVAMTRARKDLMIFADNLERFARQIQQEREKTTTIDLPQQDRKDRDSGRKVEAERNRDSGRELVLQERGR